MKFLKITGRQWHDLPMILILGLVIGTAFSQLVKLIPHQATAIQIRAKH
jgi:hypothetical protein